MEVIGIEGERFWLLLVWLPEHLRRMTPSIGNQQNGTPALTTFAPLNRPTFVSVASLGGLCQASQITEYLIILVSQLSYFRKARWISLINGDP